MPLLPYPKKVEQGKALVISRLGRKDLKVSFTGAWIWWLDKVESMDISVKTIELDRRGSDGLICQDNIRADIKVTFFVRINNTEPDVKKVAQNIGCARASDQKTLEELFTAKFSEALKTVGKQLDFVDLYTKREEFRDRILEVIGRDLDGYTLTDCAIDYLEQTPVDKLDRDNILDAEGIRKITELTAVEHVKTNNFRRNEEKQIKKQDVEAAEAIYELERQQAEAAAKQKREIDSVQAREGAEALKVQQEERLKAETARIKTEEDVSIQEENKGRQVEVAQKNRERVVAVETERVEKDRSLEVISREREVELQRIAKDKEVENEKREIANVIRERIAVEKTVAEEEEAIKRLRLVEEANRNKEAKVVNAEAEAQEKLVKDIKAAEAAEKAAEHQAREQIALAGGEAQDKRIREIKAAEAGEEAANFKAREMVALAEAELETTDRQAKAKVRLAEAAYVAAEKEAEGKVRLAEGIQAETAATGLAEVRVKDVDAAATEKYGLAEARVLREKGLAEGEAIRERIKGEAEGLAEKAKAMAALDERSRQHEEYRLRLEMERAVELATIETRRHVAEAQAEIVAEGLKHAKVDIIGGESIFFDRLVNSITMGKSVDGFLESGGASLAKDVKDVLSNPGIGTSGVKDLSAGVSNLSVAALLGQLMSSTEGENRSKFVQLLQAAQQLGVDKVKLGDLGEK